MRRESKKAAPSAAESSPADSSQKEARTISREERGDPRTFLGRASRLLANSLDYETTLRTVAGLALPYFGAWSIVDIIEYENGEPAMRRLAIVHPERGYEKVTRRLEMGWPPEMEDPIGAPVVVRTRESQVVSRVSDDMVRQAARSEQNLRDLRRLGIGSFLVVPLVARDEVLGAMTFISPAKGEVYTDEHLGVAENLAGLCGLAIANARHYREALRARELTGSEQEARRYAEAIVDTVREPLLVLDSDLRVQSANRSFYRVFKTTPEETEGRFLYVIGGGQWNSPPLRALLEDILPASAQLEDFQVEQDFATIGRRTMLLNARRVPRGREKAALILLAIEDVTERTRAEEERERLLEGERRAKQQAEQAVRAREQILGIVSHDLRSPLNVITTSLQLLEVLPPEERRQIEEAQFQAIDSAADRMDRLIGNLLDVSRIEAGRFSVDRARIELAGLLDEACRTFRTRAEEQALELRCEIGAALPAISADRDRIFQVLENLFTNAIKFTPEGGRIILRAEATDREVRVSVSDTGPGIPEEERPQLFDPYWQGEGAAEGGAGLGLSISKGIVEAHGGRIWAESEVGEGTTFHFTIPALGKERA